MKETATAETPRFPQEPRRDMRTLVRVALTAAGLWICFLLAAPFISALAWAMALAVLFTPLQRWFESKVRQPGLAAGVSVLVIALMVVVPATFVGQRLISEAAGGAALVEAKVSSGEWRKALENQPRLAPVARWVEEEIDLPATARTFASWLSTFGSSVLRGSLWQVASFCLTFYLLFFFLRDRRQILLTLASLAPLTGAEVNRLFARVGNTVFATVYGTLAVASAQGFLGGLMFWWLGLAAPLLWGVVMTLLAVVPVLGAFVVWLPAAVFLALEGSWGKALILVLWGILVVGTIDNLLRPTLVGNRLKMHTVPVFISVVGGLMLFGPAGLILGPVALTVTTVLLEVWSSRTAPAGRVELS